MNIYIFAIGGTGARVLRSLTFCLASGMKCIPDGTNFIPMIIDYDKTNGDKLRAIKNMETYSRIRQAAYDGVTVGADDHSFFLPNIQYLSDVAMINGSNVNNTLNPSYEFMFGRDAVDNTGTFADFMDYSFLSGNTYLTKDFLASLYNDEPGLKHNADGSVRLDSQGRPVENSRAELELDLSVGFRGNPNIGSIIFEDLRNDPEFVKFRASFNPAQDRVFIISSIFGGTGSSGFPRIVDAIRYAGIAGWDGAIIGASIVMPYFKVDTPAGGAINSNIFNSKQKVALAYYNKPDENGQSLFQKLTAAYFIGDDDQTNLPYSEGRDTQKNDAHIVEMLAALSIIDFASKTPEQLAQEHQLECGLDSNPGATENIEIKHFDENTQEKFLDHLTCMALAFRFYEEYVMSGEISIKEAFYSPKGLNLSEKIHRGMYDDLEDFIDDFNQWLDEMSLQTDAYKPYLNKPRNENSDAPQAEDLYDYIAGFTSSAGGWFSKGASYKDFASFCNEDFKELQNQIGNEECLFLKILYDAADETLNYYRLND